MSAVIERSLCKINARYTLFRSIHQCLAHRLLIQAILDEISFKYFICCASEIVHQRL